jgi:hypothetical protein
MITRLGQRPCRVRSERARCRACQQGETVYRWLTPASTTTTPLAWAGIDEYRLNVRHGTVRAIPRPKAFVPSRCKMQYFLSLKIPLPGFWARQRLSA